MKLKNILFCILLMAGLAGISAETAKKYVTEISSVEITSPQADYKIHTVKKGETIYSIAKKYEISVEDIYLLNKWAEKGIRTGDKLKIPKEKKSKSDAPFTGAKPDKPIAGYKSHVIETKQTLYSLGLIYNVSVNDILEANPGLSDINFQAGKTIRIPVYTENLPDSPAHVPASAATGNAAASPSYTEHKVQKGETIYGISKSYGITESVLRESNPSLAEGLKTDMVIRIPRIQSGLNTNYPQMPLIAEPTPAMQKGETMRIGILLPFSEKNGSISQDKLLEYYNGFLLAVRELKEKGYNAEIYTFDIGPEKDTKKLKSLLETVEISNLHLVIGGVSAQQINVLSEFSVRTGIKYVIPFGTKKENVVANIFQMTTSHSYLYPKITAIFKNRFRDYNIVFVSETGSDNNKQDFVSELKNELTGAGIEFKTVNPSDDMIKDLKAAVVPSKKTMFIPTSSSETTLRKLSAQINMLAKENITLFGYPDWQAYISQYSNLHRYDAYIYSIFFLDEKQDKAAEVMDEYKKWYNKAMLNSFPKYAFLGYDAAIYFMTALNNYGTNFDENTSRIKAPTLQSSVFFEQDIKDGGYINTGIYFIRFKPDSSFEKIEYSR